VRFHNSITHANGLRILEDRPHDGKVDPELIKQSPLDLASTIKFSGFGDALQPGGGMAQVGGMSQTWISCVYQLMAEHFNLPHYRWGCDDPWPRLIWINIRFFHIALCSQNDPAYAAHARYINFWDLARILVHEFAHIWTGDFPITTTSHSF
jgi:hypothetical protein